MFKFNGKSIADIVREMENEDSQGNTKISKYVSYSQRNIIDQIDAYINSVHLSGKTDALGREKPFFNIVKAVRNIWYRATDIDRKDIKIKASKSEDYIFSLIANILIKKWMRKANFSKYLNSWGRTLATYGGAVSEFVETGKELNCNVVSWNKIICDPIDFDNNPVIKRLWLTPQQLRANKNYNQNVVEQLISQTTTRKLDGGQSQDNKSNYIQIYEVYADLPYYYTTENEKDDYDVEQLFVISYLANAKKEFDDFELYAGKKKRTLRIDNLIEEDSRTIGIGSVENLFEAQWMINHSEKAIKDHLDIASKLITQTADKSFVGQNVLDFIENGDILIHQEGKPLTRVNSTPDISALQAFGNNWKTVANEISNVSEAMQGKTKSGEAWRQTEAILTESHSLFEQMIENKGIAIVEMFRENIIPYIKKQMDTSEEISEILESCDVKKLDMMFVPNKAKKIVNEKIKKDILNKTPEDIRKGNFLTREDQDVMMQGEMANIQSSLNALGNQRFIKPSEIDDKTWKEILKDFDWTDIEIDVSGEGRDSNAILTTLNSLLSTAVNNPELYKAIMARILEETGAMSAIEINSIETPTQPIEKPNNMNLINK